MQTDRAKERQRDGKRENGAEKVSDREIENNEAVIALLSLITESQIRRAMGTVARLE
jgi:hypothetical protein